MADNTLRFKVDENLPTDVADLLRGAGYDTSFVREQDLVGSPDASIASICQSEERAIVTLDLDFSDIRAYPPEDYFGLLVIR